MTVLLCELVGDISLRTLLLLNRGFLNHGGADDVGVRHLLLCHYLLLAQQLSTLAHRARLYLVLTGAALELLLLLMTLPFLHANILTDLTINFI